MRWHQHNCTAKMAWLVKRFNTSVPASFFNLHFPLEQRRDEKDIKGQEVRVEEKEKEEGTDEQSKAKKGARIRKNREEESRPRP